MLINDPRAIGNRLLAARRRAGLTQAELAAAAGLSERGYAPIERGDVCMRVDTLLKLCGALHITPDMLLVQEDYAITAREQELIARLDTCNPKDKQTALKLMEVYLHGLE